MNCQNLDNIKIHNDLLERGVNWIFSSANASHQGGSFEIQIRSFRRIMRALNAGRRRNPTDEDLLTLFKEIEYIINSHPLTSCSDDPRDMNAISPMTILTGALDPAVPFDRFYKADELKASWRYSQAVADRFWESYLRDYLPTLQK